MEPFRRVSEENYYLGAHSFEGETTPIPVHATYVKTYFKAAHVKTSAPFDEREEVHVFAHIFPKEAKPYEGFPLTIVLETEQGHAPKRTINHKTPPKFSSWAPSLVERMKDLPEHVRELIDLK